VSLDIARPGPPDFHFNLSIMPLAHHDDSPSAPPAGLCVHAAVTVKIPEVDASADCSAGNRGSGPGGPKPAGPTVGAVGASGGVIGNRIIMKLQAAGAKGSAQLKLSRLPVREVACHLGSSIVSIASPQGSKVELLTSKMATRTLATGKGCLS
jgi:hypothetical protein